MKIYLASLYSEMPRMVAWRDFLVDAGHVVTSQWIDGAEINKSRGAAATMDLADVDRADCLILMTLPLGTMFKGGGRCVEFGYALAKRKLTIIVGEAENIFCHLPQVLQFESIHEAIKYISEGKPR